MRHPVSITGSAAVATLFAVACTPAGPDLQPRVDVIDGLEVVTLPTLPDPLARDHGLRFEIVRQIETATDPSDPLLYDPVSILPLGNGDLLVHDPAADQPLVIVDPTRSTARVRFGRKGQGPGELGARLVLNQTEDGDFVIFDQTNRQVHLYGADGNWTNSRPVTVDGAMGKALPAPGSSGVLVEVLSTDRDRTRDLVRIEVDSARELLSLPDPPRDSEPGRIQRGRALWTVLHTEVLSMRSDEPSILLHDEQGNVVREIRLPLSTRNLTDAEIEAHIQRYGSIASSLRTGPAALTNELYAVDDTTFAMFLSGLWRASEDPDLPVGRIYWRVFTTAGHYVGILSIPEGFRYLGAGQGTLWGRVLDDVGHPVLQELRVARGAGTP